MAHESLTLGCWDGPMNESVSRLYDNLNKVSGYFKAEMDLNIPSSAIKVYLKTKRELVSA